MRGGERGWEREERWGERGERWEREVRGGRGRKEVGGDGGGRIREEMGEGIERGGRGR